MKRKLLWLAVFVQLAAAAQTPHKPSSSQIFHELQKLNFLGSALYIAAHPDDENTRLISWLANDVKARTAYLSITRGDGGQNLIGPEIRELLGVIRSQELLAARRVDGGSQFFTRANDFGYSKHPDETLRIWDKEEVLSDVVRTIRKFKPDVIINRFNHRTPGTTHGHHTSSAMLSVQAFDLVGDPLSYPKSARQFGVWQPKRLFFNTSWWFYGSRENFEKADKTNLLEIDTGTFYPALGLSNGEIAAQSRSMHKSQGFGSSGSRGRMTEWLEFLKGDFQADKENIFDGIDTSWRRLEGGKAIAELLEPLEENFDFQHPERMIPQLLMAYELVCELKDPHWRPIKKKQLEQLILNCAGIFIEATAQADAINPGATFEVETEVVNRSSFPVILQSIQTATGRTLLEQAIPLSENEAVKQTFQLKSAYKGYSSPYWLSREGSLGMYQVPDSLNGLPQTPAPERVLFQLQMGRSSLEISRDVVYKYTGPVRGEVYRPMEVLPEVTTRINEKVLIFPNRDPKTIQVAVHAGRDRVDGTIQLNHPEGWQVAPAVHNFELEKKGMMTTVEFVVTPPEGKSEGYISPLVKMGNGFFDRELVVIDYDHIPYQRVLLPSRARVARVDIARKGDRIGYIEGAGDALPQSLEYIGYQVRMLDPEQLTAADLKDLDAVVIGIRAFNTVPELRFKQKLLFDYVKEGGVVVAQYNTSRGLLTEELAPYPLTLSRNRVTDEESPVRMLEPEHPAFNHPNVIGQADFEGWVQERGLYFPSDWDTAFTPLLAMNDPGEAEFKGSLLLAPYGKGYYVYTGLSFFRELPAGVSGAYRLFANLLSLGN